MSNRMNSRPSTSSVAPTAVVPSNTAVAASAAPVQVEDPTYGPLERARNIIDERLSRDERWLGIGDSLTTSASSSEYIIPPNPAWAPLSKSRTIHLPDRLFEEYDFTQSRCSMGLLPEIERAWVSVDHRLFLWDWADGSDITTFEELTDVIVGVALVVPRPGVFVDVISHLLVLTTPTSITLVGLGYTAATGTTKRELTFYLTGLSCPTDGVSLTTIRATTSNGRIFLSSSPSPLTPGGIGGDGCLYELMYQSAEGWFSKKCTLVNLTSGSIAKAVVPSFLRSLSALPSKEWIISLEVDTERGLLYGLLRNGTIEMYQLPSSSNTSGWDGVPSKVARCNDILKQAQFICPSSPMLDPRSFEIIALEIVSLREGGDKKIGLVAITTTGVRLYFTHQKQRGFTYYAASNQPAALELFHVRPPPAPAPAQTPVVNTYYGQPSNPTLPPSSAASLAFNNITRATYSSGGVLIAANSINDDIDVLLVAAPDIGRVARTVAEGATGNQTNNGGLPLRSFSEVAGTITIEGRTWGIVEITPTILEGAEVKGGTALNELATQATQPRREWVVLTNMGANVLVRQRPVDTLIGVLEGTSMNSAGAQSEIGIFFESYGRDQSCAMLLTIAAGNSRLTLGEPSSTYTAGKNGFSSSPRRNPTTSLADHAKALFFEGGGRPVAVDRGGYGTGQNSTPSDSRIIFSGRHEGLAFYFARLIRSIWRQKITVLSPSLENRSRQISNVSDAVLSSVQRDLSSLRSFVEQEHQLFTSLPSDSRSSLVDIAYTAEQASLSALRLLLIQSVEAISFILLLIDYKISDIIASCALELQNALLGLTYQQLLTTKGGRDVARSLVSAIINQQIGQQLSVDAISDILQQRCGSFCSADDVLLYKAIEALGRAKDTSDGTERIECLRESLRLFITAAKHLTLERLKQVCGDYNALYYPLGVIDLAQTCANEWDITNQAASYWSDAQPKNDSRASAYALRKQCYDLVFETLERMDDVLNDASQSIRANQNTAMSYDEADGLRTNAYNKALSVKDELFHVMLYDWYISKGMTDQLLETRTPYLEHYLSRGPMTLEKYDLLWQYYSRLSQYANAASILADLAETSLFNLTIQKRVEYLSLAVGNAKSQYPSNRGESVEFLTDIEEKLEVAQVQIEIYREISESTNLRNEEKGQWLAKLEGGLLTISDLYQNVAEPLEMLEMILLIFHVSDHRDPFLVAATWEAILARAHEEPNERRIDVITSKIVNLGRRFLNSDVSFPLDILAPMFEKYSYENRNDVTIGWVPLSFHAAGVPWESIFIVFDELFSAKVPPFQTKAGTFFVATDIATLISSWLSDSTHSASPSTFPATGVDTAIGKYLMALSTTSEAAATIGRLQECQREIRRRF